MKLDLSNFFKDERSQALVFIDANWLNIKDVQDHIQNLFKLTDINLLTTDGCFLPPKESIQVLKEVEGLKAFRFSDPGQNDFASPAPVAKASKKRKHTSAEEEVELPSSTPSRPSKRSKKKSSVAPEVPPETSPDLSIVPFEFQLKSSQNSTKYDNSNEEPSASSVSGRKSSKASRTLQKESSVMATVDQTTPSASFSVSGRKSSKASRTLQKESSVMAMVDQTTPSASFSVSGRMSSKASRTLRKESSVMAAEDQKTLEEEPAPLQEIEIPAPPPIVFRCPLMELDSNTARTFELPAKSKIVIIENIEIKPANGIHLEKEDAADATEKLEEALVDVNGADSLAAKAEESELLTSTADPDADTIQEDELPENTADFTKAPEAETSQIEEKVEPKDMSQANVAAPAPARFCAEGLSSDSEDDVMVLDDTNVDDSDSDVQAVVPAEEPENNSESNIIRDMLQSAAPLDSLPSRGDTILFKLKKVKGNPASGNTDFIAGNCTYINRRSKVITLEVISCPSEFTRILRQYSSSLDESGDEVRCLNVNSKDLIEAKIIVATID